MKKGTRSINILMDLKLRFFLLFGFFTISVNSFNQPVQTNDTILSLVDSGRKIENSINIFTTESVYNNIKAITGNKIIVKATILVINGDTIKPDRISIRGETTLYYRRKSFHINLKSPANFHHGDITESLRKFDIISLSMDKYYLNNRLAFELMGECQFFNLFYSFCEIRVNGQSEGMGMVIERPQDWAIEKMNSPLVIRRGYNHHEQKIAKGKNIERDEANKYNNFYKNIYRSLSRSKGQELYKDLSEWMDLELYMKWLAFNFIIRNGDYTDEVYFYIDPATHKFKFIPWDYDDLFHLAPHEGISDRERIRSGILVFSVEDQLDKIIATDPYLYKMYLIQFKGLLNQLSSPVLKKAFESTFGELFPYYKKEEIIDMSKYDAFKDANLVNLKNEMVTLFKYLTDSRVFYLNYLDSQILK